MKIKLLREMLVGPADVKATASGTVVDMDDSAAKELIVRGLAEESKAKAEKAAAAPLNKMEPAVLNKAIVTHPELDENRDNFERVLPEPKTRTKAK